MPARETRLQRGRRNGRVAVGRVLACLRDERMALGLSQRSIAAHLGWSQSEYSRFESGSALDSVRVVRVAEIAALLGLELSVGCIPPVRRSGIGVGRH